ncbi:MAG: phage major tail tube protein [Clostridiaceae bacterium]
MAKVGNKVISYSVYVRVSNKAIKINDTTSVELPSLEFLTDSIKGAGILGEVDLPSYYQPGSMSLSLSLRVTSEQIPLLIGANELEIRWVTDIFDTSNIKVGTSSHKAFIKGINKKFEEGKLEPGSAQDASFEYEAIAYKRIVNGKEVLNVDKFNNIFALNGTNLISNIQAAL